VKFRGIIFANLFRKKVRLILTIGSFTIALVLFGFLATVKTAFSQGVEMAEGANRLIVVNRISIIQPLPLKYRDQILRVPGVKSITHDNWFGGIYQDEKNFFPQFAIDVENQRKVLPELVVAEDQWQAFVHDRQGAIAGEDLIKRFGWKIGDRIPIKSTIFGGTNTWEFNLVGIYHATRPQDPKNQFWFQWDHFQEGLPERIRGNVGWYIVSIENPDDAVRITKAIDDQFANSPFETRTATESTFAANWAKQLGNVEFLIVSIGTIVFFTLLLVTGNTMAIAVRERTAELAVFKAVGFSDRFIMFLVMAESLVVAIVGGTLGLGLAKLFTVLMGDPTGGWLPYFHLHGRSMLLGFGLAVVAGAVSGLLPAIGAMRLRVVDAMRRV
jgi:putative ABC transport system permease protein